MAHRDCLLICVCVLEIKYPYLLTYLLSLVPGYDQVWHEAAGAETW